MPGEYVPSRSERTAPQGGFSPGTFMQATPTEETLREPPVLVSPAAATAVEAPEQVPPGAHATPERPIWPPPLPTFRRRETISPRQVLLLTIAAGLLLLSSVSAAVLFT